jgi:formylglycine-generating enzyme required for sulfatase activity
VPSGSVTFPTGVNDDGTATITDAYEIGETQVTYELWYKVKTWAESNGYIFANPGREGSAGTDGASPTGADQEPVTYVNWFDAVVWCNALTEWYNAENGTNLAPVYYYDSGYVDVAKNSTSASKSYGLFESENSIYNYASAYPLPGTTGFRLPTSNEWELAARWQERDNHNTVSSYSNPWFTKGNSASGATVAYDDATKGATENAKVAVYGGSGAGVTKTAAVRSKAANALDIYDMSGNVWEWCFDWYTGMSGFDRITRGGSWYGSNASGLQVSYMFDVSPDGPARWFGFRLAKTTN